MSRTISMPGLVSAMLARSRVERSELELELLSSLITPWYFRIFSLLDLRAELGGLRSPEHTPDSRSRQSVDLEVELQTSASSGVVRDIPVSSGVFLTSQSDLRRQILHWRLQRNKLFTEKKRRESREMILSYDNLTTDDCSLN